jgi:hypothetical protein
MTALYALLLSLNLVSSTARTQPSTVDQINIAVSNKVATQSEATTLSITVYDPNEGRTKK